MYRDAGQPGPRRARGRDDAAHYEGQEEVLAALTAWQIAIEGTVHDVPPGGVVRVAPDVVRNLLNERETGTHVWLAFGAPPVGTVEDFGAYVVADDRD